MLLNKGSQEEYLKRGRNYNKFLNMVIIKHKKKKKSKNNEFLNN